MPKMLFNVLQRIAKPVLLAAFAVAVAGGPAMVAAAPAGDMTAVLAGGCFWGMDEVFSAVRGVDEVTTGYSGGQAATAHYEMVSEGDTGHAESVRIRYNPKLISYRRLLEIYFLVAHDPTQVDRQAPDVGPQYRSEIFYADAGQRADALRAVAELTRAHRFASPIATKIEKLRAFYPAEAYHQHFAARNPDNPYIVSVDAPKLDALRHAFPRDLKP